MSTYLSRGKLNIGLVQEQAKKELLDLLDKCEGSKVIYWFFYFTAARILRHGRLSLQVIVWDDGLSGPFGLIAEYSVLKKRDAAKMHVLRRGKLNIADTDHVIFITRPHLEQMTCVSDNILQYVSWLIPR